MDDVDRIVAGLTKAQRDMLTRPPGEYNDATSDIRHLMNERLVGTTLTPLGTAVRARLADVRT